MGLLFADDVLATNKKGYVPIGVSCDDVRLDGIAINAGSVDHAGDFLIGLHHCSLFSDECAVAHFHDA